MTRTLDVNCDLGESFGNWRMGQDEAIMPMISTANVACGFHAGDPVTLIDTVRLAEFHGLAVGAHPGLPDLLGFGRRRMAITPGDAYALVVYQVGALQAGLATQGMTLHHVKPHGSFMSMVMYEQDIADAVMAAVRDTCQSPMVYVTAPASGTALEAAAEACGVRVVEELYPDLSYADDGSVIVQRKKLKTDVDKAKDQLRRYLHDGEVLSVNGKPIRVRAESLCVHGDGPNALEVVTGLLEVLREEGIGIRAIARAPERTA
ncbi:5-oxoprolinase subunit PxpA [Streptomyces sp. NPDC000987]|uniref:LamB/YcsF family protein n=1 Tax=Streptomyces sp. NPDC000987 TaxID=3154374 RepID=UPI0033184ED3